MIDGRFAAFEHDHAFTYRDDGSVILRDEVRFTMPWETLGDHIGRWILLPHICALMERRFAHLKRIAEGEEWWEYLPDSPA